MTREQLVALAQPLLARLSTLDPSDPALAARELAGFDVSAFETGMRALHATGAATPREQGGVRFGRLAKPGPDTHDFSIDIVEMQGGAVGAHTHPSGEFDLCFVLDGAPRFDGREPGWVIYPPGSRHVPTVTGGRMLIAYFLPQGQIRFDPA